MLGECRGGGEVCVDLDAVEGFGDGNKVFVTNRCMLIWPSPCLPGYVFKARKGV